MRHALLLLAALAAPAAHSQGLNFPAATWAKDWTTANTITQGAIVAFQVGDWAQTRYIAKHPEFYEVNPLIGKHPSVGKVNNYFAISIPANIAISMLIPSQYRALWQASRLTVQISLVSYNKSVGIGMEF